MAGCCRVRCLLEAVGTFSMQHRSTATSSGAVQPETSIKTFLCPWRPDPVRGDAVPGGQRREALRGRAQGEGDLAGDQGGQGGRCPCPTRTARPRRRCARSRAACMRAPAAACVQVCVSQQRQICASAGCGCHTITVFLQHGRGLPDDWFDCLHSIASHMDGPLLHVGIRIAVAKGQAAYWVGVSSE